MYESKGQERDSGQRKKLGNYHHTDGVRLNENQESEKRRGPGTESQNPPMLLVSQEHEEKPVEEAKELKVNQKNQESV